MTSETRLLPFLGLACAVGVSSIYYNQPLLLEMRETFLTTPAHNGLVAMATQIGYAAGLLFFVPLGDVRERRWLMMRLFGGVAFALLLVALAPTLQFLIIASALAGAMASVTHIVLPLASEMVPHGGPWYRNWDGHDRFAARHFAGADLVRCRRECRILCRARPEDTKIRNIMQHKN